MHCNLSQFNVDRSRSSHIRSACKSLTAAVVLLILPALSVTAAELHIGGATVSITPDEPVALSGQMHTRIARTVESPVTATALALESRDGCHDQQASSIANRRAACCSSSDGIHCGVGRNDGRCNRYQNGQHLRPTFGSVPLLSDRRPSGQCHSA